MRRLRLIPLVMLAQCVASTATLAGTSVGILAGYCFSNLRIENQSDLQGKSSFAAGGVVDYGINDRFGIRVEPTFLSKGTKATKRNAYWSTMDGVVFKLDYIDVPILARYDLATTDTHGYLLGGPSFSFATRRDAELTQGQTNETVDMSDALKSYDLSLDLGAGVSFGVSGNR